MVRLPDIPIASYLEDQAKRFRGATDHYFDALEFDDGARQSESAIPPDYPFPGGPDQWEQAAIDTRAEELRREQEAEQQRKQQEELVAQQMQAQRVQELEAQQQQEAQARDAVVMGQARNLGIPTPDEAFASLAPPDHTSTTGIFDARDVDQGQHELPGSLSSNVAPALQDPNGPMPAEYPTSVPTPDSDAGPTTRGPTSAVTPQSPAEEFNLWAQDHSEPVLGPPQPDNTSSSGLLDRIGQGAAEAVRPLTEGYGRMAENIGQGKTPGGTPIVDLPGQMLENARQILPQLPGKYVEHSPLTHEGNARDLEDEARRWTEEQGITTDRGFGSVRDAIRQTDFPEWRAANPDKAAELDRARDENTMSIAGMVGVGGGGGLAEDAIAAIKAMRAANLGDDLVLAAEQKLSQMTPMTLDEVQKLTGTVKAAVAPRSSPPENVPEDTPWPLIPEERALNEAADARARNAPAHSGYVEDPSFGAVDDLAEDVSSGPTLHSKAPPEEHGLPPEKIPEIEHRVFEPRERITSFGDVPEGLSEEATRAVRQERGMYEDLNPRYSNAQLDADVDAALGRPGYAAELRARNASMDPNTLAQEGRASQKEAQRLALEYGEKAARARAAASEATRTGTVEDQAANSLDATNAVIEAAEALHALREGVFGVSKVGTAYARGLNALKGPYQAARQLDVANRLKGIAEGLGKAGARAAKAAKDGVVDEETLNELGEAASRLRNKSNRKILTEGEAPAEGAGAGKGRGSKAAAGAEEPSEETLAEKLGRLKRQQTQLTEAGSDAERADVASEIGDVIEQMREEAITAAQETATRTKKPLTLEEAEAAVNRAIGQKVQTRIRREELAKAKGFAEPAVAEDLTKAVEKALTRDLKANKAEEVSKLAEEARTWMQRIREMPNQLDLKTEFEHRLTVLADHSNAGDAVAQNLREQLETHLSEDSFRFLSSVERRNAEASDRLMRDVERRNTADAQRTMLGVRSRNAESVIKEAQAAQRVAEQEHIDNILERIDTLRKAPYVPGITERLKELAADLTAISERGYDKSVANRKAVQTRGLVKAGIDLKNNPEQAEQMRQLLDKINPNDPSTLLPVISILAKPNLWNLAREISFVNLLSRPTTHATNFISTAANIAGRLFVHNPISFLASGGHNSGVRDAITGTIKGNKEARRLAAETFWSGTNPTRFESQLAKGNLSHVEQEVIPYYANKILGTPGKWWGERMHMLSTRPLEAMDAMLGHMAYSGAVAQEARQKADRIVRSGNIPEGMLDTVTTTQQRGTGQTRVSVNGPGSLSDQVFRNIMSNIWDHEDVIGKAGKIAEYSLYRGKGSNKLESGLRQLMSAKEVGPNASFWDHALAGVVDLMMPFYNVPMNFAKQGVERTIPLIAGARALHALPAAVKGDRAEFGNQMAKASVSAATMSFFTMLGLADNLTDEGPRDAGQRRIWLKDHKVNSIRIPMAGKDAWVSWEGMPWAIPAASVAGGIRSFKESQDKAAGTPQSVGSQTVAALAGGAKGMAHGMASQTLLQNIQDTFKQITGDESLSPAAGAAYLSSTASRYTPSPVPTGMLAWLASVMDHTERDAGKPQTGDDFWGNIGERYKINIPKVRESVNSRLDAYGEDTPNAAYGGADLIPTPGRYRGTTPHDRITDILQEAKVGMPTVSDNIPVQNGTRKGAVPLTMKEQRAYQQYYGQEFRSLLEKYKVTEAPVVTDAKLEELRGMALERAKARMQTIIPVEEAKKRWRADAPIEVRP